MLSEAFCRGKVTSIFVEKVWKLAVEMVLLEAEEVMVRLGLLKVLVLAE